MTFKDELEPYLNVNGVVQDRPVPRNHLGSCDNLIFTVEACVIMWKIGSLTQEDKNSFKRTVKLFLNGGLLMRPDFEGQQQQDDFLTVPCLGYLCDDASIAKEIYQYGQKRVKVWGPISFRYVYNNDAPDKFDPKAWMARNPAFVPNLKFSMCVEDSRNWPSIWEQIKWAASIIYGAFFYPEPRESGGQDYWLIPWVMVSVHGAKTPITRFASRIWWRKCQKVWPKGMRECFRIYFGLDQPEHALGYWADCGATER